MAWVTGTPATARDRSRSAAACAVALVALAAVATHLPGALSNGFTNWDDDHYLTLNPLVRHLTSAHLRRYFTSFQLSNYHPLALLAHALWHRAFGLDPLPHHLLSVGLHTVNAVLVLMLAGALGARAPGALTAALLFAAHPLQVETVAWAAQLKTLLASAFFSAALLSYAHRPVEARPRFPSAALALTACSLLAKPAAVTAPLVLLLLDRLHGRRPDRRALWEKAPFALLAVFFGVLTLLAQQEALRSAAARPRWYAPFFAAHGVLFLLAKALAPFSLSALYPAPEPSGGGLPWSFLAAPVALGLLVALLWRPLRRTPAAGFGALFFVLLLAPTLQLVPVGLAHTADRYFYLASPGLFLIAGLAVDRFLASAPSGSARRRGFLALLAALLLGLGALSRQRATVWRDGEALWTDVVRKYPASYFAWGNLGQARAAKGDTAGALPAFARALDLVGGRFHRAKILFDRGVAYQETGDPGRALADYTLGLQIDPGNAPVLVNRGNALDALGRPADALADYSRAIALEPDNPLAWRNRGVTLERLGDHAAAAESFDRARRLDPGGTAAR